MYENFSGENGAVSKEDPGSVAEKRHAVQVQSRASVQIAAGIFIELHSANGRQTRRSDSGHHQGTRGGEL